MIMMEGQAAMKIGGVPPNPFAFPIPLFLLSPRFLCLSLPQSSLFSFFSLRFSFPHDSPVPNHHVFKIPHLPIFSLPIPHLPIFSLPNSSFTKFSRFPNHSFTNPYDSPHWRKWKKKRNLLKMMVQRGCRFVKFSTKHFEISY